MEWLVALVTIVAGSVTVTWFVRDVRKENSKVLKSIAHIQEIGLEIQKEGLEIQKSQLEMLAKMEESQMRGLEIEKSQSEMLVKMEEGQMKGFERLAQFLAEAGSK